MIDCTKTLLKDYKMSGKYTSSQRLTANSNFFGRLKAIYMQNISEHAFLLF